MVKWFSRCPLLCTPPRLELGRTDSAILVVSGSYLDPESSDAHYFALGTGKQSTQTFVDTTHTTPVASVTRFPVLCLKCSLRTNSYISHWSTRNFRSSTGRARASPTWRPSRNNSKLITLTFINYLVYLTIISSVGVIGSRARISASHGKS